VKKFLIILGALLLVLYLSVCWFFSNLILIPPNGPAEVVMAALEEYAQDDLVPGSDYFSSPTDFTINSTDGTELKGWFFKADSSNCGIIMAHGWSNNRTSMNKYFSLFEDCRCDIVTFDHRGHGISEAAYATGGIKEAEDLLAVTDWYQKESGRPDAAIGWLGISWGGATVLQAGAEEKNVAFIVSDSPFQDWNSAVMERAIRDYGSWIKAFAPMIKALVRIRAGVSFNAASSRDIANQIEEPVFLIHSAGDSATASSQSINIAKELDPANSVFHHTQWGNDHAKDISNNPEEFKSLLADFLNTKVSGFGACNTQTMVAPPE